MNDKILFAHNLRGFASFSVVIAHLYGVFWFAPEVVESYANVYRNDLMIPTIVKCLNSFSHLNNFSFFSYGQFGVALFFLISGFVIPFSFKKYNAGQFLIARFFRIYPTYFIGFSVSLLSIYFGGKYFGKPFPYDLNLILKNVLFLRDIFWVPSIDGIIWTLEIEMKFYLVCALLMPCIINSRILPLMVANLLFLILFFVSIFFQEKTTLVHLYQLNSQVITFMFIGTLFYFLYFKLISELKMLFCLLFLFTSFVLQWYHGVFSIGAYNTVMNYSIALICFFTFYIMRDKIRFPKIFSWLADISYSLYVVHGIFSYALMSILLDKGLNPNLVLIISTSCSLLISTLFYKFVEIPSINIGKKIAKNFKTSQTK